MMNPFEAYFRSDKDFLLPPRYRRIGICICILAIPIVIVFDRVLRLVLNLGSEYWIEWGLYMIHIPWGVGLYLILFSQEKQEDEFYLNLRLRSVAKGVVMIVTAIALLPIYSIIGSLIVGRDIVLPDIGGNMAVCTLLLVYTNAVYAYAKYRMANND